MSIAAESALSDSAESAVAVVVPARLARVGELVHPLGIGCRPVDAGFHDVGGQFVSQQEFSLEFGLNRTQRDPGFGSAGAQFGESRSGSDDFETARYG